MQSMNEAPDDVKEPGRVQGHRPKLLCTAPPRT